MLFFFLLKRKITGFLVMFSELNFTHLFFSRSYFLKSSQDFFSHELNINFHQKKNLLSNINMKKKSLRILNVIATICPLSQKSFFLLKKNSAEFYFSVSHKKLFSDKFFFLLIKILLNEFFYSTLVFPLGNFFHEFHTILFLLNLFLSAFFFS